MKIFILILSIITTQIALSAGSDGTGNSPEKSHYLIRNICYSSESFEINAGSDGTGNISAGSDGTGNEPQCIIKFIYQE